MSTKKDQGFEYYVYTGFSCEYFKTYEEAEDYANNFVSPFSGETVKLEIKEMVI